MTDLRYPFETPPAEGEVLEVAPGILWARLPLPFRLNHVNIYFLRDGDGWAVFDAGIASPASRAAWEALLSGPMAGERFTKLIVSHAHPDHIGLAGWLCARLGLSLLASQTTWLSAMNDALAPDSMNRPEYREDYLRHGLEGDHMAIVIGIGHDYLRMVEPLPPRFRRLLRGDSLQIGTRSFEVLDGNGHAPEQTLLLDRAGGVFLAADQVLAKISPNIGIWATEPDGDPLGHYMKELAALSQLVPEDVLVLPGHQLPFYGLHSRAAELIAHHEERLSRIVAAVGDAPRQIFELLPFMFRMPLSPHETTFAFFEARAHANRLVAEGRLAWSGDADGRLRLVPAR